MRLEDLGSGVVADSGMHLIGRFKHCGHADGGIDISDIANYSAWSVDFVLPGGNVQNRAVMAALSVFHRGNGVISTDDFRERGEDFGHVFGIGIPH